MKIVSGGQTGVDRAALDAAIAANLPHGGWCPLGRRAEDGPIPYRYQLIETRSDDYAERTDLNILNSDGTVIFNRSPTLAGGTALTADLAQRHGKPWHLELESSPIEIAVGKIAGFVRSYRIEVLNVAGARESEAPGIGKYVEVVLSSLFQSLKNHI